MGLGCLNCSAICLRNHSCPHELKSHRKAISFCLIGVVRLSACSSEHERGSTAPTRDGAELVFPERYLLLLFTSPRIFYISLCLLVHFPSSLMPFRCYFYKWSRDTKLQHSLVKR